MPDNQVVNQVAEVVAYVDHTGQRSNHPDDHVGQAVPLAPGIWPAEPALREALAGLGLVAPRSPLDRGRPSRPPTRHARWTRMRRHRPRPRGVAARPPGLV